MKNYSSIKAGLLIETIILLISLILTSMSIGYNILNPDKAMMAENYDCYHISEISSNVEYHISNEYLAYEGIESEKISKSEATRQLLDGPHLDSPWPMYCHDVRHSGRSPYSTANNTGFEKWRFNTGDWCEGSAVIDTDGFIYVPCFHRIHALYPNSTKKWTYWTEGWHQSGPAIDEKGILYIGSSHGFGQPSHLAAIFTNNGSLKWKYKANNIYSSPAIGNDRTIYFGDSDNFINALYPNGSLKWRFKTNNVVYSSPAIGQDGIVYCGSHDTYLYALFPNNGTLKWKYKTGNWIRTSPCIADDGTIFVVSLDDYLHAIYPNGTQKWKTNVGAGTSPTIGQDGTIYCGYTKLYAVNPDNGTIKWTFNPGNNRRIRGATPCNSIDGTIYFGTSIGETDGGEIIAVNSQGNEKWRKIIANEWVEFAPAIDSDGTVYIGSTSIINGDDVGYFYAFGKSNPEAPSAPEINGPTSGRTGKQYDFTFKSTSPLDKDLYYWIEWGDGEKEEWIGLYSSEEEITVNHTWSEQGLYIIKARAKDTDNLWGPWSEFEITIPRTRTSSYLWLLERFPLLERLLNLIRLC